MSDEIVTKRCPKCKTIKPVSEFYRKTRSKDGYQFLCKICHREEVRVSSRKYGRTLSGKITQKHRREKDVEKCAARTAVSNAIRLGNLSKASDCICHKCPNQAYQYHHWSYEPEHWLDVQPVCQKCHTAIHCPTSPTCQDLRPIGQSNPQEAQLAGT